MTKRVNDISIPSIELRADALVAVDRGDPYRDWAQLFPCLNELQVMDIESNHVIEDSIRIGTWNLERGKEWQRAADLIERENIEVLFLSEMDLGMSRSGQQHTAKELAARLGWHGLFAVEFVELELGNPWEIASPVESTNVAGLHGNAILSQYPLHKPWLHRFTQSDGSWWHRRFNEPRLGGRIAVGATLETSIGPVEIFTTHLENNQGPIERADALRELFDRRLTHLPSVFGGDLNTSTLNPRLHTDPFRERAELAIAYPDRFLNPCAYEPLFDLCHHHEFRWGTCNTKDVTQRPRERGYPKAPLGRIDWFFVKQLIAQHPKTIPAIGRDGLTISDHDLIVCDLLLR